MAVSPSINYSIVFLLRWILQANISEMLSLDLEYLGNVPEPVFPWGQQPIHKSASLTHFRSPNLTSYSALSSHTGIYSISKTLDRTLPTTTDTVTHETIHSSVLQQPDLRLPPGLKEILVANPYIVCKLLPLEEEMKKKNVYIPGRYKSIPESEVIGGTNSDADIMSFAQDVVRKAIGYVKL